MQAGRSSPALHKISTVKSSPKWTFRSKSPGGRSQDTPGPGAYNSTGIESHKYNKTPHFSFGAAPRDTGRNAAHPGPGQYSPPASAQSPTHRGSAKYGFGTSQRKGSPQQIDQPGPGAYQVSNEMGQAGPKYTAGGKRGGVGNAHSPGPGSYTPSGTHNSGKQSPGGGATPQWRFGTSPRDERQSMDNPGPGAYNHEAASPKGPKYSMRSRSDYSRTSHSPGPGEYGAVHTMFT